jgi:hypothetical protein
LHFTDERYAGMFAGGNFTLLKSNKVSDPVFEKIQRSNIMERSINSAGDHEYGQHYVPLPA